jgi:hypothetical protein
VNRSRNGAAWFPRPVIHNIVFINYRYFKTYKTQLQEQLQASINAAKKRHHFTVQKSLNTGDIQE